MSEVRLAGIEACVFDAYGTLLDVHSAVARHRERIGEPADRLSAVWRAKQLEYTWLRSLMHRYADFEQVTAEALDYAMETAGVHGTGLRDELLAAYQRLDCYPEVPVVLRALKQAGMRTAVLSNGSPRMLRRAVDSAGLGGLLDELLSVDVLAMYKPHPDVYRLATRSLGVARAAVCFQSSNAWDVAGAASFGFRVVWVNRFGQPAERLPHGADVVVADLGPLPGLVLADPGGGS